MTYCGRLCHAKGDRKGFDTCQERGDMRKFSIAMLFMGYCVIAREQGNKELSFRPDPTLFENVHGGVVVVLSDLQRPDVNMDALIQEIEGLQSEVETQLGTSQDNTIRSDDREYLQKMIDRIDQLINALEGSNPRKADQLRASCGELKRLLD